MNYIVRAAFNRPEMFFVSLKSEEEARNRYCNSEYKTLFCIEYGAPKIIDEIIERFYPFEYEVVRRPFRHFGWGNILEGFNEVSQFAENHILNLEDDCIVHPTYFEYIDKAISLVDDKCSVINASNRSNPNRNKTAVNSVKKTRLFEATCCLIFKDFYNKYVKPYATYEYYKNREKIIKEVNDRNGNNPLSKFRPERNNLSTHIGWDGLVNRLVDTAAIEEDMYCISPEVDRRLHIGFYGQNRPGKFPSKEEDFSKRVEMLVDIIKDTEMMGKLDGRYNDYELFPDELNTWDGNLTIV